MNRLYPFNKKSFYLYTEYLGSYSVKKSVFIFIGLNPVLPGEEVASPARALHTDYWLSKLD